MDQPGYLERLAELDARLERARADDAVLLARAAGLLAGRVECRIGEAHAYLLRLATERGERPGRVASEVVAALEADTDGASGRLRSAVDQGLRKRRPRRLRRRRPAVVEDRDWVGIVAPVLDILPGSHVLLSPVRDGTGAVVDYDIVGASPAAADAAGRRGDEMIGLRVREAYPATVDGPIWHACGQVLEDGIEREIGPLPYEGSSSGTPATFSISTQIRRVGPGLLNSWVRHDQDSRLAERIAQTERLGRLGWGEWDLVSGEVVWSDGLYRIYERDPREGPIVGDDADALTVPEDRPLRQQAAETFARARRARASSSRSRARRRNRKVGALRRCRPAALRC